MNTRTVQDDLFKQARIFREEGQEVHPTVFFISHDGRLIICPLNFDKAHWRAAILGGIQRFNADTVILHTEAWVVEGKTNTEMAIASKMAGLESLEDFPGRHEVVQSSMECRDGTRRNLWASIDADGKLGSTEEWPADMSARGELVGFFS